MVEPDDFIKDDLEYRTSISVQASLEGPAGTGAEAHRGLTKDLFDLLESYENIEMEIETVQGDTGDVVAETNISFTEEENG